MVSASCYTGEIQALRYGFGLARILNLLISQLILGNIGGGIPTYVRNDRSDSAYQVDSANTVTNGKRIWIAIEQ